MVRYNLALLNASVDYGGIYDLTDTSVALAFMALGVINARYLWHNDGDALTDSEWDALDSQISLALEELMSGLVGLVVPAVFATASISKFIPCDGGIYNKDDYPRLYDALDSQYILSGTQFTVPDLRDKFVTGSGGSYAHGDTGGQNTVQLSVTELPSHDHSYSQYTFGVDIESVGVPDPTGVGQPALPQTTGATGGNTAHENRPPFFAIPFYIIAG